MSCSLWLMSTPRSSAPDATPRCTPSTSFVSSRPTWSSKARRFVDPGLVDFRAEEVVE